MKRDSLKINQNNDGSFTAEWDKNDPEWSFLNGKTSKEIQEMIENLLQADNERIQRLQDEMINAQTRLYDIEQILKSINTYSQEKSNQSNLNERQKSSESIDTTSKIEP